jgi:hypothetical protein
VNIHSHSPAAAGRVSMLHVMSGRRRDDIRPGSVVQHRGSVLGVVERVAHGGDDRVPALLYVRGGRSGALEYLIPRSDVVSVLPSGDVAVVHPDVGFPEATLERDGHVTLLPRPRAGAAGGPRMLVSSACVGYDCFAEDGRTGLVEQVRLGCDANVTVLVLRVRRLGRRRRLVVPAGAVIAVDARARLVLLRGTRRQIWSSQSQPVP